jgi:glutamate-1-semialdehyde 2,1-aminomutase
VGSIDRKNEIKPEGNMERFLSQELYLKSQNFAPAGVHSPVRAFRAVGGYPIFFKKGSGPTLEDVDGNHYVDFCMSWGALILGHANPNVVRGIQKQVENGTHFGTPTALDVELSSYILEKLPFYDKIRFVNSGTEAVMTAVRLARGVTGKDKIIKVDGSYHGHVDSLLVSAGSGLLTQGEASSKGVTEGTVKDTITIPYQNVEALEKCFAEYKDQIAALILEPVMANSGLFAPTKEWMKACRDITTKHNALLIFDEVITGFRIHPQGAVGYYGITPDIGTYGKIIGGGLPVGAVCAKNEIMNQIAPLGGVYQAGTLSGNPLCMIAGLETLKTAFDNDVYDYTENHIGKYLDEKITALQKTSVLPFYYKRVGSIFWLCPGLKTEPKSYHDITAEVIQAFKEIYHLLLKKGVYLSPSVYEVAFLSLSHKKEHIDHLVNALASVAGDKH